MSGKIKQITIEYLNGLEIELKGTASGNHRIAFYDVEDGEILALNLEVLDASVSDDVVWFSVKEEAQAS